MAKRTVDELDGKRKREEARDEARRELDATMAKFAAAELAGGGRGPGGAAEGGAGAAGAGAAGAQVVEGGAGFVLLAGRCGRLV